MSEQKKMTVSQALAEGYTHWGYDNGEFQHLSLLEDITDDDFKAGPAFERCGYIVLAQKEPYHLSITGKGICDIITDDICSQDNYKDDSGTIEDALHEMPEWNAFAEKINAVLKQHPYWYLTEIQLVPDEQ